MPDNLATLKVDVTRILREGGIGNAPWEARKLLSWATGLTTEQLAGQSGLYCAEATAERLMEAARRRAAGMPLAYILGDWDFYGLSFLVNPDVLIPRNDTETLCALALDRLQDEARVLDLCCGSGCLGLTVAHYKPRATVVLADISDKALTLAQENRKRLSPQALTVFCSVDALSPPPENLGRFDMILCNPPYVTEDELLYLEDSVRCYEPRLALYGGEDGLDFYRSLSRHWQAALRPRGLLCLEVGWTQAHEVCALLEEQGWRDVEMHPDTQGIQRVVIARRCAV